MGVGSSSVPVPEGIDGVMCVSFHASDTIRILHAPDMAVVAAVEQAISGGWEAGIKTRSMQAGVVSFQLNESPWEERGENCVGTVGVGRADYLVFFLFYHLLPNNHTTQQQSNDKIRMLHSEDNKNT